MPNRPAAPAVVLALGAVLVTGGACNFGQSGVEPPLDKIFLPGGLAADPSGQWLYAVNSNSDLRFNSGTLVAIDAAKAARDRQRAEPWESCPTPGFLPDGDVKSGAVPACCWDYFDARILNCDDRAYVDDRATVRIGSFGSRTWVQPRKDLPASGNTPASGRLYVSVRSEPSVTFLDLYPTADGAHLSCEPTGAANALCDDAHKIRGDYTNTDVAAVKLLEEPNALVVDEGLGLMYVGHLVEGLSVIDVCGLHPTLSSTNRRVFSASGYGVTSVVLEHPGDATAPVIVTGRHFGDRPGEVQTLALQGVENRTCDPLAGPRHAELVEADGFYSSAFYTAGTDIHGMVEIGDRAFVLHRNAVGRQNPPAVVEIDRSLDPATGRPRNQAVGLVEICTGATEIQLHDPGHGQRIYVTCFEAGQIYVLAPDPLALVGVINVGRGPNTLVFAPKDQTMAYVAGFSDNNVSVIDLSPDRPTGNRVVQRIGFPQLKKL